MSCEYVENPVKLIVNRRIEEANPGELVVDIPDLLWMKSGQEKCTGMGRGPAVEIIHKPSGG
jgi:hypothetical protein